MRAWVGGKGGTLGGQRDDAADGERDAQREHEPLQRAEARPLLEEDQAVESAAADPEGLQATMTSSSDLAILVARGVPIQFHQQFSF